MTSQASFPIGRKPVAVLRFACKVGVHLAQGFPTGLERNLGKLPVVAFLILVLAGSLGFSERAFGDQLIQSAREIPVAYDVDVLVIGGSTGACAAAIEAAKAGAKVFLAAPYPYLGEDITATLRLWLEPGEHPTTPLAQAMYDDPLGKVETLGGERLAFTYQADQPSATPHRDTSPPSMLTDGQWGNAVNQSVQYNADVAILADLGKPAEIGAIRVIFYHRSAGDVAQSFKVESIAVEAGDEPSRLKPLANWSGQSILEQNPTGDAAVAAEIPLKTLARYVRVYVKKTSDAGRVLLGELEILAPADEKAPPPRKPMPRPLHIKQVLDEALLEAGVQFLFSCYPCDVVRDAEGRVAGMVMANRAGRQAVLAKCIIDATDRAVFARLAGAKARPYPAGTHSFEFVVIGGEPKEAPNLKCRTVDPPFVSVGSAAAVSRPFPVFHYTVSLPVTSADFSSFAAVEQQIRTLTYDPRQQFTSDVVWELPPDPIFGEQSLTGSQIAEDELPLGVFQPEGIPFVYILGPCADVPREVAQRLFRPVNATVWGARLGQEVARAAKNRGRIDGAYVPGQKASGSPLPGDVREFLTGVRPVQQLPTIKQEESSIPVLGKYDVVVVGGGTGGAPAGIAAARQGARTLVIEYLHGLGGVGTEGAISSYYWGNRVGFTAGIPTGNRWQIEEKKEWFRRALLDTGAEIWFGTIGCGAVTEGNRVKGVVVATPQGRGVVLASAVIDATGNADIAAAAGAPCIYTDETEFAMQGTGLPPRNLGASYTNTDFTLTDETDMVDVWHVFIYAKDKYRNAFDQGRLIDTRERRRICGEFVMTLADQLLGRTYPDTIEIAYSNFDTHGYTVDPLLEVEHPDKKGFYIRVPYRCLLPQGTRGLLVGSLAASMHRDAVPMTRMQADIQNQGYAAGVAAAMAAKSGVDVREIDIRALQKHLVEIGNLPPEVLTETDNFPLPMGRIEEAIRTVVAEDGRGAAVLLSHPEQALPLLKKAYSEAELPEHKLLYAHILALLGDATGLDTLLAAILKHSDWDEGWDYRGMGQFGQALSPLDRLIIAAGRTRSPRAVPAILDKLNKLGPNSEFSHYRSVALALELIGDPSAARPLAELLSRPYMTGYTHETIEDARRHNAEDPSTSGVKTRRDSLRELLVARALFRCGDYGDQGRQVLERYTRDLRGHLARHAKAVLEYGPKALPPEKPR